MEKETQIKIGKEKMDCYVLKMATKDGVHQIWVDKNRFIVRRSQGIALQKTTTVELRSVSLNVMVDDSSFTFTPPDKVTRVAPRK